MGLINEVQCVENVTFWDKPQNSKRHHVFAFDTIILLTHGNIFQGYGMHVIERILADNCDILQVNSPAFIRLLLHQQFSRVMLFPLG